MRRLFKLLQQSLCAGKVLYCAMHILSSAFSLTKQFLASAKPIAIKNIFTIDLFFQAVRNITIVI